jgi:hypothetical protein
MIMMMENFIMNITKNYCYKNKMNIMLKEVVMV